MSDKSNPKRKNAMLTPDQRRGLLNDWRGFDQNSQSYHQLQLVDRVKHTLKDFRLLSTHLSEKRRSEIFEAEPRSREFVEMQADVRAAIAFLYAGLNGEAGFRRPLLEGVADGEKILGNVDSRFDIESRFAVDYAPQVSRREAVEIVENGEWDRLSNRSLFTVLSLAHNAGAIDFEEIHELLDRHEEAQERLESMQSEGEN